MMQLFIDNPQLGVLIPEQSRVVGYYQALKAAIELAKTAEEKMYFQNLMDKMIYNKSFLANNQPSAKPSYTSVQRMMA